MNPFKVALFRTRERRSLQLAARELGHGLRARSPSELATIRRELSESAEEAADDYATGFMDAIEHVLAGLAAELKHRDAITGDVAAARLRKNASKVLVALHRGCHLPTEIAAATGLKLPTVSAELAELEGEELVERDEPGPGEDQRTEPRLLTIRGAQLADELTRTEVSPTAHAARDLAPLFVELFNQLVDEAFLAPQRSCDTAIARLGTINGPFVWNEFIKHANEQRLISYADSALTLTSLLYRRRLRDLLDEATSNAEALFLAPMKLLATAAPVYLRASTSLRDRWQVAIRINGISNACSWSRDDARAGQLVSRSPIYHIVWEDPGVMTKDLNDAELSPFIGNAAGRHCYVASNHALPASVERIELDATSVER